MCIGLICRSQYISEGIEKMYYDYKSPILARGEGNFKIRLDFTVNNCFRENILRHFVSANSRIRHCFKLDSGARYALYVNLSHKADFEAFHHELISKVPGIAAINKGVIGSILKY